MNNLIREFEFFMNQGNSYHVGACTKGKIDYNSSYLQSKKVERVVIGTVRISKDGSLAEVVKEGK